MVNRNKYCNILNKNMVCFYVNYNIIIVKNYLLTLLLLKYQFNVENSFTKGFFYSRELLYVGSEIWWLLIKMKNKKNYCE